MTLEAKSHDSICKLVTLGVCVWLCPTPNASEPGKLMVLTLSPRLMAWEPGAQNSRPCSSRVQRQEAPSSRSHLCSADVLYLNLQPADSATYTGAGIAPLSPATHMHPPPETPFRHSNNTSVVLQVALNPAKLTPKSNLQTTKHACLHVQLQDESA
jgi:hypothetical protein